MKKYDTPNNLCFKATWISPETNKPVTAIHFGSFLDCIRDKYNRDRFITIHKRF